VLTGLCGLQELRGYCNCGITLVCINTYRWPAKDPEFFQPGMYAAELHSEKTMQEYMAVTDRNTAKPHAWNLASHCHRVRIPSCENPRAKP